MRHMVVLAVVVSLVVICSCADGYQIAVLDNELSNDIPEDTLFRQKRQMETFDDEDLNARQQEPDEPGFWDRVVKIAVSLFAKFVEWLNS